MMEAVTLTAFSALWMMHASGAEACLPPGFYQKLRRAERFATGVPLPTALYHA